MKRLIAVLMLFGLVAAACGSDEADDAVPAATTAATAASATTAAAAAAATTAPPTTVAPEATAGLDELNVAYFLEWPTANQVAQVNETYDAALGIKVNWLPFGSGGDMALAMESGDIDISYSQGLTPFANFVT
ncbi:MAG: hypothetical protein QF896_09535, partial [Acidimicrobiales bacterium]|nr:hypothetical protein [Acidimicrobiales bacterium]